MGYPLPTDRVDLTPVLCPALVSTLLQWDGICSGSIAFVASVLDRTAPAAAPPGAVSWIGICQPLLPLSVPRAVTFNDIEVKLQAF